MAVAVQRQCLICHAQACVPRSTRRGSLSKPLPAATGYVQCL
jgi:hypothetical protein